MVRPTLVNIQLDRESPMGDESAKRPDDAPTQLQSVRSTAKSKTPLPRYTSIDLENEIPEMYNTSLNPAIHDPDMTMFFNRNAPPFHTNYAKRHSPPPSYSSRTKQASVSSTDSKSPSKRRNWIAGCFLCIFIVTPLIFLIVFYVIPRVVIVDRPYRF